MCYTFSPSTDIENMSRLLRGICLLKKPPANKISKPLALCKVELCGKDKVLQSLFRPVVHNNGQNRRKERCNKIKRKEGEEQLRKRDYKEALLRDMKSKVIDIG